MMVWRSSLAGFSIRTKGRRALRKNFSMSFGSLPMSFLDFVPSSSLTAQTGRKVRLLQNTKSTVLFSIKL